MPSTRRIVLASIAVLTAVAAVPAAADPATRSLERPGLRAALAQVHKEGVPAAYAQVEEGRREWAGAAGIADLSNARPARADSRHRVGSITKTFVATRVLQLVGEGRLGLDDPVSRWLPEELPPPLGDQVTVRMLLNHTSGIGNYTDALLSSLSGVERARVTTFTPQELVRAGLELPPTGAPGESYSYSNTGYILAGLIIQRITGRDPAVEITERILRPLRLDDTSFPGTDPRIRGPHAGAHLSYLGVRDLATFNMSWAWMAGELISTMDDLNDFYAALLGGRVLRPAQLEQMRTTVPMDPSEPEAGGYGLGIYWMATPCGQVWGHDGGVVGQVTVSLHDPASGRRVSAGINLSHYQVPDEPHPIDAAFYGFVLAGLCPDTATTRGATATLPMPAASALRLGR